MLLRSYFLSTRRATVSPCFSRWKYYNSLQRRTYSGQAKKAPTRTSEVGNLKRKNIARKAKIAHPEEYCKCVAYSTNFNNGLPRLRKRLALKYSDVGHPEGDIEVLQFRYDADRWVFLLQGYGLVFWGLSTQERIHFLGELKGFIEETEAETEEFKYSIHHQSFISGNHINLTHDEETKLTDMLVLSYGMARSVKLGVLEEKTGIAIEKVKTLSKILSTTSKKKSEEINKRIEELLDIRGLLNLHTDLSDAPDICWEDGRLESLFFSISRQLDIQPRIRRINDKLNFGKELMDELKHQATQKHNAKLEWIIIVLIAIEVLFAIEERDFFFGITLPYRKKLE